MAGRRSFIKKSVLSLSGSLLLRPNQLTAGFSNEGERLDQVDFWKSVRNQFPLTDERVYFNNGTIGPSPYPVLKAVRDSMQRLNTWGEYSGYNDSRNPLAEFLHVLESEICLTHNTTEGINIVAAGLPLSRGDEVIMTTHEHAGNALPWLNQKNQKGIVINPFTPASTADETLNLISGLITSRTRVIAVPHITCTTGHVLPVKKISQLGREKGLWVFLDGAHGPGSMNLDIKDIGCDFYASCGHKWLLGPSGTGILFVKKEMQDILRPVGIGAHSDLGWEISENEQSLLGYVPSAHRYDYGTQSAPLAHGLKAAIEFMENISMQKVDQYSSSLANALYDSLQSIGHPVELLTPAEKVSRHTMITFRITGRDFQAFGKFANENKYRIRLVPESGLDAIRISTHIYNNQDQINGFVEMLKEFIKS